VLVCLALSAATLVVFWPISANEFVSYDDSEYISENPYVQGGLTAAGVAWAFTAAHAANWHPLTWLSLMLDRELQGPGPGCFHRTNLLLHVANTVLLLLLLWRLTGRLGRSAVVAAFFALHPLHVESVAWAAERKDVLSTLFGMLTLWSYVWYVEKPGPWRYLLVLVAFALGLLAKPMLVTLPCVLLLLDYWPLGRGRGAPAAATPPAPAAGTQPSWWRLVVEKLPLFALSAAACAVTLLAQRTALGRLEELSFLPRLLNALTSYVAYLGMTLWPSGLAVFYPYSAAALSPAKAAGAALLLALVTAGCLWQARQRPYLLVGWLWYLGTLVPVIGLIQVGSQAMADRYTYVPLIGVFVALVWGVGDLLERWRCPVPLTAAFAGLLLGACMLCTWLQVTHWQNNITLWQHALDVTGDNWMAQESLGVTLAKQGDVAAARGHLVEAVRLSPRLPSAHFNLATVLERLGDGAGAQRQYEETLSLDPQHAKAHHNLGVLLWSRGQLEEAAGHYVEAVRLDPTHAGAQHNLGVVRWAQGRREEAAACFRRAVELRPDVARHHSSLAYALHEQGREAGAQDHYREALRLDPNWPDAFARGAWQLATAADSAARDGALAVQLAQQACQATGGGRPEYLDALAAAWAEVGRFDDAARAADRAAAAARAGGKAALADQIERRLSLYRAHQPFRQGTKP
jgi:Flp pilus assembly protein TadD